MLLYMPVPARMLPDQIHRYALVDIHPTQHCIVALCINDIPIIKNSAVAWDTQEAP